MVAAKFHELPAHRVIMCARAEYCRAALSLQYGFAESGAAGEPGTGSGTDDNDDDDDANSSGGGGPVLRLPVSTPEALAALRRVLYTGSFPAAPSTASAAPSWASTIVELASGLEYLMLRDEAAACTARLARVLARDGGGGGVVVVGRGGGDGRGGNGVDRECGGSSGSVSGSAGVGVGAGVGTILGPHHRDSWRDVVGVSGALEALNTAAACRRWEEVDLLLNALSGAYGEASLEVGWETTHPELREAIRRGHVERLAERR